MIWKLKDAVRGYRELVKENFWVCSVLGYSLFVSYMFVGAVERKKGYEWRGRGKGVGNPGIGGTAVPEMITREMN